VKSLITGKMMSVITETISIVFVGVTPVIAATTHAINWIPALAGSLVAFSLFILHLAKAYKIYSETKRDSGIFKDYLRMFKEEHKD
jgi:hypothetical protein